jgi:hypothetical protein
MYIEADARMDTFQTQDGSNQTRLNLVQRKTRPAWSYLQQCADRIP